MKNEPTIGIAPPLKGLGGMVSFQKKFISALDARGIAHSFDLSDRDLEAILLIGGPRSALRISKSRRAAVRIVQRLDGINWLHRKTQTGWRHWLRAEANNAMLRRVRNSVADSVIYQSRFVQEWWHKQQGASDAAEHIIHNGVDLELFSPKSTKPATSSTLRILMVEGNIGGGYELGLGTAIDLLRYLRDEQGREATLSIAGNVARSLKQRSNAEIGEGIEWLGVVDNMELPIHYRAADMLFSADLNAACPNSVIEALACGLPVLAFKTGALPELVDEDAGILAEYGGEPWELDEPDITALADAALQVKEQQKQLRQGARARAEAAFDLNAMTEQYLDVLLPNEV